MLQTLRRVSSNIVLNNTSLYSFYMCILVVLLAETACLGSYCGLPGDPMTYCWHDKNFRPHSNRTVYYSSEIVCDV